MNDPVRKPDTVPRLAAHRRTHHARHSKAATVVSPRRRRIRYEAAQLAAGYAGLRGIGETEINCEANI